MFANLDLTKAKELQKDFLGKYAGRELELYKDCQGESLTLSEKLEALDPSCEESVKHGIDAFSRQLIVNGLETRGIHSVTVEQLANNQNLVLLPELVLREVQAGKQLAGQKYNYEKLVAVKNEVKGVTYNPVYVKDALADNSTAALQGRAAKSLGKRASVGVGAGFPKTTLAYREKDVIIKDYGRELDCSYKVVRNMPWDEFRVFLNLIGVQLAMDKIFDIYDLGVTGDGTVGAASDTFGGTAGSLSYNDLVTNFVNYKGFTMNAMLCPTTSLTNILTMAQFQDPLSNWKFQQDGTMVTPFGAGLYQVETCASGAPTGTVIVTMDPRFAVRETFSQPLLVEAEKIISYKFEKAVISEESVFSILADGAIRRIVWT